MAHHVECSKAESRAQGFDASPSPRTCDTQPLSLQLTHVPASHPPSKSLRPLPADPRLILLIFLNLVPHGFPYKALPEPSGFGSIQSTALYPL